MYIKKKYTCFPENSRSRRGRRTHGLWLVGRGVRLRASGEFSHLILYCRYKRSNKTITKEGCGVRQSRLFILFFFPWNASSTPEKKKPKGVWMASAGAPKRFFFIFLIGYGLSHGREVMTDDPRQKNPFYPYPVPYTHPH